MLQGRNRQIVEQKARGLVKRNPATDLESARQSGLSKISKGQILKSDPEVLLAVSMDGDGLDLAFEQMQNTYLAGKKDIASQKLSLLRLLLAYLRATHWLHWTSHWQVKGDTSYGDHLLFERLYLGVVEEIDTLSEKLVGEFGSEAVNALEQSYFLLGLVSDVTRMETHPVKRGLLVEQTMQNILKRVYDKLKSANALTLGLDDYIMATANAHETNLYLLKQRLPKK